jgi:hypothetical protein
MLEVLSGNRMSDDFPGYFSSRYLFSKADWVLLPHRSTPSKRMKAPLIDGDELIMDAIIGGIGGNLMIWTRP